MVKEFLTERKEVPSAESQGRVQWMLVLSSMSRCLQPIILEETPLPNCKILYSTAVNDQHNQLGYGKGQFVPSRPLKYL